MGEESENVTLVSLTPLSRTKTKKGKGRGETNWQTP